MAELSRDDEDELASHLFSSEASRVMAAVLARCIRYTERCDEQMTARMQRKNRQVLLLFLLFFAFLCGFGFVSFRLLCFVLLWFWCGWCGVMRCGAVRWGGVLVWFGLVWFGLVLVFSLVCSWFCFIFVWPCLVSCRFVSFRFVYLLLACWGVQAWTIDDSRRSLRRCDIFCMLSFIPVCGFPALSLFSIPVDKKQKQKQTFCCFIFLYFMFSNVFDYFFV